MTCDECKQLGIPDRLCKSDKPVINSWEDIEVLYRRHPFKGGALELKNNEEIINELFKLHDDSYNRSSLSFADDVLLNDNDVYAKDIYLNYSIVQIRAIHLLKEAVHQINNDSRVFTLVPVHDPKDCNYSHSEIQCFVDGAKAAKKPKSINTVFRKILTHLLEVVKEAS